MGVPEMEEQKLAGGMELDDKAGSWMSKRLPGGIRKKTSTLVTLNVLFHENITEE